MGSGGHVGKGALVTWRVVMVPVVVVVVVVVLVVLVAVVVVVVVTMSCRLGWDCAGCVVVTGREVERVR